MSAWLNHVAIAAPRNGTTSHTVDPNGGTVVTGTNFSPTAGRYLVCYVSSSTTSTTPSGWTLGASAINNSGGYEFHRASAAGGDTVTSTMGASNLPRMFDFYEYPAGTTFVNTVSAISVDANGGAGPSLGSLSGTNQVNYMASQLDWNATTYTGSWGTGTELVDYCEQQNLNDGYVYGLAESVDFTGSSASSAWTSTFTTMTVERLVSAVKIPTDAITFDARTIATAYTSTGTQTTSHAAAATARAAVVLIDQNGTTADEVSGVTYGGAAMTRLRFDTEATEAGATYIYWLDNIATGTQNVAMTTTAATNKQLVVATMTVGSGYGIEVAGNDTGTSASVANPSWTISGLTSGNVLEAFEVIHSGLQAMTNTPATNWTLISSTDLGSQGRGFARQSVASSGTTLTCGWTAATADDFVAGAVAFRRYALTADGAIEAHVVATAAVTADIHAIGILAATSVATATMTATIQAQDPLDGITIAATAGVTADIKARTSLEPAAATATTAVSITIVGASPIAATIAATSAVSATLQAIAPIATTIPATSGTGAFDLTVHGALAATSAATSAVAIDLRGQAPLAPAAAAATATVAASIQAQAPLAPAAAAASATVGVTLQAIAPIEAISAATATVSITIERTSTGNAIDFSVPVTSGMTAAIGAYAGIAATAAAQAGVTADLNARLVLEPTAIVATSAMGTPTLTAQASLAATTSATSTVAMDIVRAVPIAAPGNAAVATVSVTLTTPANIGEIHVVASSAMTAAIGRGSAIEAVIPAVAQMGSIPITVHTGISAQVAAVSGMSAAVQARASIAIAVSATTGGSANICQRTSIAMRSNAQVQVSAAILAIVQLATTINAVSGLSISILLTIMRPPTPNPGTTLTTFQDRITLTTPITHMEVDV